MKFSCGKSPKKRWEIEKVKVDYKKAKMENFHKWWAWYPITVGVDSDGNKICVWMEWVERRFIDVRIMRDENGLPFIWYDRKEYREVA